MGTESPMVLFVCHANICRSPMAERLARHALAGRAEVTVASAGTHAVTGEPMHHAAAHVLAELGAEPTGFTSQPLTVDRLDRARLVLTADRVQRAICVTMFPPVLGRAFTLRQFSRLAAAMELGDPAATGLEVPGGPDRLAAMLSLIPAARARLQPVRSNEDDLLDPVRGSLDDFRACAMEIKRALRQILAPIVAG